MEIWDIEKAKNLVKYDGESGRFTWKINNRHHCVNDDACKQTPKGYLTINILSRVMLAHRVAYMFVHGNIERNMQIDHINGIRDDNRICNLRIVSHAENCQNRRVPAKSNKSGFLGVSCLKGSNKFQARISFKGKQKFLGYFDNPKDAHDEYLKWKRMVHDGCTI